MVQMWCTAPLDAPRGADFGPSHGRDLDFLWSGRRDSNPRPSPWQVDAGENWRMPATDSAGKYWLLYISEPTRTAAPRNRHAIAPRSMMSDDSGAIARAHRAGAAVRVGSLMYRSQYFPALSVAGIRQFSPASTCQGEGRGFESRRPLQRKSRSRPCEGPKSAPRGASRGAVHHICTTFAVCDSGSCLTLWLR